MIPTIITIDSPTDEERVAVLEPLRAFNIAQAGPANLLTFAVMLKDASGRSIGGLWGHTAYGWMFIQYLAIPPECRGQDLGNKIMRRAEDLARDRGCIGAWLDTYSFQAREFYEKLGYSVFGRIDDHPVGHQRYFLNKRFEASSSMYSPADE